MHPECHRCGYEGPPTLVVEGDRTTRRCAECDGVLRREDDGSSDGLLQSLFGRVLRGLFRGRVG